MKERYLKIDWSINLEQYATDLLRRPGNPVYVPIEVDLLTKIVPQLDALNQAMQQQGWAMFKPKTMTMSAGTWGGVHIDNSESNEVIDLGFNIPILNGTSMITRWYDLSKINYTDLGWQPEHLIISPEKDRWFRKNIDYLINECCVDSMLLDKPCLFRSDDPHNVDGRHSPVTRSILSIRWINLETNKLMSWADKDVFVKVVQGF